MSSKLIAAVDQKLFQLNPDQKWIKSNLQYEVIMGSMAYGVSNDSSDVDIYGWCIPPKGIVFPHTQGHIPNFGPAPQNFESFQLHHVKDPSKHAEYDFTIFSVVKYLGLVAENNPNIIDSLFVPQRCVTQCTAVGSIFRDHRKSFLHKGAWHRFKGYAYSQINKIRIKKPKEEWSTKRKESIEKFGWDVKQGYHVVRLLDEVEQILTLGDLDLGRNREQLKAIRRGEWTFEQLQEYFESKEKALEDVYLNSKLPDRANWVILNERLMEVLETHYGSLSEAVRFDKQGVLLNELKALVSKYGD